MTEPLHLYSTLAEWYPLLTPVEHYEEEAAEYHALLADAPHPPTTLLELGCGQGANAFYLKHHYTMTLTDLSPDMLALSRAINPECEHLQGDMRTLRLNRQFDGVFIHDAITYMTTLSDLRLALETAALHCNPGGVVLVVPDCTRETFAPHTKSGGSDAAQGQRGMRYLQWTYDPDPADSTYVTDFAYLLRHENGHTTVDYDRHVCGLFSRQEWLDTLQAVGLPARAVRSTVEDGDFDEYYCFVGIRESG